MRTVSVIYLFMQRSPQTFLLKSFTRYSFGAILFILQEQPKEPPKNHPRTTQGTTGTQET